MSVDYSQLSTEELRNELDKCADRWAEAISEDDKERHREKFNRIRDEIASRKQSA